MPHSTEGAMPTNSELLEMPVRLWAYLASCWELPMNAPVCIPFWEKVMVGCFAIGAAITLWLCWQFISYRLKLAAALKAQAERDRVADPETMKRHTWAEIASIEDVTDPRLAEKIRQELDQRRLKALTGHG